MKPNINADLTKVKQEGRAVVALNMPRPRKRVVTCDCWDCLGVIPRISDSQTPFNELGEAAARQEPPPTCLLLVLTGLSLGSQCSNGEFTKSPLEGAEYPHLDALAREGCSGLLAVRNSTYEGADPLIHGVRCISQLLGMPQDDTGIATDEQMQPSSQKLLQERFLGIQGGIISNREELLEQGVQAGLRSLLLMEDNTSISDIARLVANSLGQVRGGSEDECELLVLHIDGSHPAGLSLTAMPHYHHLSQIGDSEGHMDGDDGADLSFAWLEWIDTLLGELNKQNGYSQSVLTCAVLGCTNGHLSPPLQIGGSSILPSSSCSDKDSEESQTKVTRPRQSFETNGLHQVLVDTQHPLLVVQRLQGVTRKDNVTSISAAHLGCAGAMLVDHLLREIAYKLARSKKYGA